MSQGKVAAMTPKLHSESSVQYQRVLARLVRLRQEAGLSRQDLANRVGLPLAVISKIESGKRRMDPTEFHRVCQALGQDDLKLFGALTSESV